MRDRSPRVLRAKERPESVAIRVFAQIGSDPKPYISNTRILNVSIRLWAPIPSHALDHIRARNVPDPEFGVAPVPAASR